MAVDFRRIARCGRETIVVGITRNSFLIEVVDDDDSNDEGTNAVDVAAKQDAAAAATTPDVVVNFIVVRLYGRERNLTGGR
jgi:hypothetical protein